MWISRKGATAPCDATRLGVFLGVFLRVPAASGETIDAGTAGLG